MIHLLIAGMIMFAVSMLNTSFLIGSYHFYISGFSLLFPVFGLFFSVSSLMAVWLSRMGIKSLMLGKLCIPTMFYIPTLGATWYLTSQRTWLKAMVPVFCALLFYAHPVGWQAAVYTTFWIIPVVCSVSSYTFARMLGSTFTAHALGSVFWVYMVPMLPEQFIALMPVVVCERLMMATLMTISYFLLQKLYAILLTPSDAACPSKLEERSWKRCIEGHRTNIAKHS